VTAFQRSCRWRGDRQAGFLQLDPVLESLSASLALCHFAARLIKWRFTSSCDRKSKNHVKE